MKNYKLIPLNSIMKDIYLVLQEPDIKENFIMEYLIRGLEQLHVKITLQKKVQLLEVTNHQALYPECMVGLEYILYQREYGQTKSPAIIKEIISDIQNNDGVKVGETSEFTITNFRSLAGYQGAISGYHNDNYQHKWEYLPVSKNAGDIGIVCGDMFKSSCTEWYIPDGTNSRFVTSFQDGLILIAYYQYPMDDEGNFLIPDNPELREALEYYALYNIYRYKTHQSVQGAQSLMGFYENKWKRLKDKVKIDFIMPTLDDYIEISKMNRLYKTKSIYDVFKTRNFERFLL